MSWKQHSFAFSFWLLTSLESSYSLTLSHRLKLPLEVPALPDYLLAFFRSSSYGPWWLDEDAPTNADRLDFYRGNWLISERTGERSPLPMLEDAGGLAVRQTRPAQLAVIVQQSPSGSEILVHYRFLYPTSENQAQQQREREKAQWNRTTVGELTALAAYLQESLRLAAPPAVV